ncbi:MAG: GNAT family N-acetyltransferase [Deltaproteobacteria bacterium]|jgi:[ribosomal protein S18]-alanine N-acetyltransferase|nr:GNAT family N-acetyltransferase [Deltaproteobacteria bacterium]MBT4527694.1 GNAT family N-acetyltransferase [Deltaproteobacteria bacterium]
MLKIESINVQGAITIASWEYAPPYNNYNQTDPVDAVNSYLLDKHQYHLIYNFENQIIGYCCFGGDARVSGGDYSLEALDVGFGMRPDLTGHGNGNSFLSAILEHGIKKYQPQKLRLSVAAFNKRAINLYKNVGFNVTQAFQNQKKIPFIIMIKHV